MFSPLLANEVVSLLKLKFGPGMFSNDSVAFDIFPSLLPVGTLHDGPPCK